MTRSADLVVVGGGIAGSALAAMLARDGYQVVLLERQTAYRGEGMCCVPGVLDVGHPEACEALTRLPPWPGRA